jgi:hypothetical protein
VTRRTDIEIALRRLAPRIPDFEAEAIVDHARDSAGLRQSTPETAAWLAMTAYVRHALTDYDALLDEGYDPDSARFFVLDAMNEILAAWGAVRRVSGEEAEGSG